MKITFYPDVDKSSLDNGVISEISWQRLHDYLELAFGVTEGERLVGIIVTELGVKAKFDRLPLYGMRNIHSRKRDGIQE